MISRRRFRPGLPLYTLTQQIHRVAGSRPFTWRDLKRAGVAFSPSTLVSLRLEGILSHPIEPGEDRPRLRQYEGTMRDWILTDRAIEIMTEYEKQEVVS